MEKKEPQYVDSQINEEDIPTLRLSVADVRKLGCTRGIVYDTTRGRGSFDDGYSNEYRNFPGSNSIQSLPVQTEELIIRSQSTDIKYNMNDTSRRRKNCRSRKSSCLTHKNKYYDDSESSCDNPETNESSFFSQPVQGTGYQRKNRNPRKYSNTGQSKFSSNDSNEGSFRRMSNPNDPNYRITRIPESLQSPVYNWSPNNMIC